MSDWIYVILGVFVAQYVIRYTSNESYYVPDISREARFGTAEYDSLSKESDRIALDTLTRQSWIPDLGVCAGGTYYRDLWTRDAFFSCLGLLSVGEHERVRRVLRSLREYQRTDGLVPLRIGSTWYSVRFLFGVDIPGRSAVYTCDKAGAEPTDSCPQLIVLTYLMYTATGDHTILQEMINSCEKAYSYMWKQASSTNDGLLHGRYFDTWHDTYAINGPALFSNVFWTYSHQAMEKIRLKMGNSQGAKKCAEAYRSTQKRVIDAYWNGTYLKMYPHHDYFEMGGNALAVLFGIVDREKAASIFRFYDENAPRVGMRTTPTPVTIPTLPDKYVYWPLRWIGLGDYHNKHLWPWIHCLGVAAANHRHITSEALRTGHEQIMRITATYGHCYERLDPITCQPIRHIVQSTEIGFSESAGMMLFATHGGVIPVSSSAVL